MKQSGRVFYTNTITGVTKKHYNRKKKLMTSAEKTQGISFFDMDPAVTVGILDPLSLFSR